MVITNTNAYSSNLFGDQWTTLNDNEFMDLPTVLFLTSIKKDVMIISSGLATIHGLVTSVLNAHFLNKSLTKLCP